MRRDVAAALATSGLAIVGIGLLLGIPLGLVIERLVWNTLQRRIGFESRAVAGTSVTLVIAVALLGAAGDRRAARLGGRAATTE